MVPLIISHDRAVHKDMVKRWKTFALDIDVNLVRMVQSVPYYNVVIVGKFFNKGSWVSDAWRKDHPEEFAEEPDEASEMIPTVQDRRELLHLDCSREGAVCVRPSGTPPPPRPRLTSAGRCDSIFRDMQTNQPA